MKLRRRAFLASAATAGALAGCLGGAGSGGNTDATDAPSTAAGGAASTTSSPGTAAGNASATAPALDHPSAADLASQPVLGPAVGEAPSTVIAFEDPSCHNCRRFNENTFPKIESNIIEPGEASFVYRNYPHAFEWGKPAMQALEATFARRESAFWELEHHYFTTQEKFGESNVLDRTRKFLASETGLDAAGVVADAEAKEFDDAVKADTDAGNAAGVVSTPTFYLFREGEFLTDVRGAQSYDVFAQALGV